MKPWWVSLILLFRKSYFSFDYDSKERCGCVLEFKNFRGVTYVVSEHRWRGDNIFEGTPREKHKDLQVQ